MWLIAAEALVFAWPRTAMTGFVTLLALPILVLVCAHRALSEPHAVSAGIFTPVGIAAEAGRGFMA